MLTQYLSVPALSPDMLLLVFLEGLAAFLSPCVVPMIPVYLLYLGGDGGAQNTNRAALLRNTVGFVLGFTLLFMALGAGATALGRLLSANLTLLSRLGGAVLIVMGLQAVGALRWLDLSALFPRRRAKENSAGPKAALTPLRAVAFGVTFAVTWTPCVGAYLGAALTMAGQSASLPGGLLMLLCFSLGLGLPFLALALLYHRLTGALDWIKRRLRVIQVVSGALLIAFGIMMASGVFGYWSRLFS